MEQDIFHPEYVDCYMVKSLEFPIFCGFVVGSPSGHLKNSSTGCQCQPPKLGRLARASVLGPSKMFCKNGGFSMYFFLRSPEGKPWVSWFTAGSRILGLKDLSCCSYSSQYTISISYMHMVLYGSIYGSIHV